MHLQLMRLYIIIFLLLLSELLQNACKVIYILIYRYSKQKNNQINQRSFDHYFNFLDIDILNMPGVPRNMCRNLSLSLIGYDMSKALVSEAEIAFLK